MKFCGQLFRAFTHRIAEKRKKAIALVNGVRILTDMTNTNNMPTSLKQGAEIAAQEFARNTAISAVQITIAFGETTLTVWFHRDGRVTE